MAIPQQVKNAFMSFIEELIEKFATEVYTASQNAVPVVTGELKNSGTLNKIPGGYQIKYSAPYASLIDGMGENATFIYKGGKSFRFPKAPLNASGFVSNTVESLEENNTLGSLIYQSNTGAAARQYDFYIQ